MRPKKKAQHLSVDKIFGNSKLLGVYWENISGTAYAKDAKGRFLLVNNAYAKAIGLLPEQIIGKTEFNLFPKRQAKKMVKDDENVIKTGKPVIDRIEKGALRDGSQSYVLVTKFPRYSDNGRIIGLIGAARDITKYRNFRSSEEKRTYQARKVKMLEDLNKSKSEFVAAISHELRTPLAIIKQLFLLLYDETAGPINDRQREVLVKSRHNIERLKNMIDHLLDVATMERDAFNLRYSLVNLNDLFRNSRDYFVEKAQEKNIRLRYFLSKEEVSIFVDPERIDQVITNLINNSIKFTHNNNSIKIEVRPIGSDVRIGVIDTGTGIKESELPKVFDKFTQFSHDERDKKGIGMGLPIVKELVEKHKGQVWVESEVGVGTKFYFTLPRFYTAHLTSKVTIRKINSFLDRKLSVYVVNILLVNYKQFKEKFKIDSKKLSKDLQVIVRTTMILFFPVLQVEQGEFVADNRRGKFSIIFPNLPERKVAKFCNKLKESIKDYFLGHNIDNAFVALGISSMSSKAHIKAAEKGSPSVMMRELYIGSQMRQYKRINYKTKVEVRHLGKKKEVVQTVDISQGGICFMSRTPMKIDAMVIVKFKLLKKKKIICTKGRVAWLRKMKCLQGGGAELKAGVEFHKMSPADMNLLANELKLYYE